MFVIAVSPKVSPNKDRKIELTEEELQKMLDIVSNIPEKNIEITCNSELSSNLIVE